MNDGDVLAELRAWRDEFARSHGYDLGAMAAATLMMGCYAFALIGSADYYAPGSPWKVPRPSEIVFLLSLGAAGLLAGQVVRQAQRLVQGYPVTVEDEKEAA